VVRLPRPELVEPERADTERLRLDREERDEREELAARVRRFRVLPDARDPFAERLLAAVERVEVRERPRVRLEGLPSLCCFFFALWRLTSLLKRLLESSSIKNARLLSSNLRKKSSQEISSSVSSPLNPGKSMRRMPGSPLCSVRMTVEGTPPRSSTHRRISSWSVVVRELAI